MSKELDYLDDILKNMPMTLNKRMIIECIKEKIQRLETIDELEQELGCPLEVFFEVIATKKVYIELPQFNFNGVYFVNLDFSTQDILDLGFYVGSCKFSFSDYKKTWWLREDKSE